MIALLLLSIITPGVQAADISCPPRWAPAGWIAEGVAPGQPVRDIGVIVGDIVPRAVLRGIERKTRDGYVVRFSGLGDYAGPVSRWAVCSYGLDARLLRKMPDNTTECVATVRQNAADMRCK